MLFQDQDTAGLPLLVDRVESGQVPGWSCGGAPGGGGGAEAEFRQERLGPPGGNVQDSLQATTRLDAADHPAPAPGLHLLLRLLQGVQAVVPLREEDTRLVPGAVHYD